MRYVLPTTPNVCFYTTVTTMHCQISTCSTTDTGFISTNLFSSSSLILNAFAEIHQKKMLKMHVTASASYLLLSSSTLWQTTHATGAIKAVIHTVNRKFRKLKKNNVRNTDKNWQLKQEVLKLTSMCIHAGVQRRDREQKKFCENKTSTSC